MGRGGEAILGLVEKKGGKVKRILGTLPRESGSDRHIIPRASKTSSQQKISPSI